MKKDLQYYVKVYNDWLSEEICDLSIKELEKSNWQQHDFYLSSRDEYVNRSGNNELDVSWDKLSNDEYFIKKIWDAYYRYVLELNIEWFNSWNGFAPIRYNRYNENKLMALHCDHIQTLFDGERKGIPILTCLGSLNDDYEGGDFVMFDDVIEFKKGSVVVFPSVFLYPHKVEPVTKGTRYSFVTWAW